MHGTSAATTKANVATARNLDGLMLYFAAFVWRMREITSGNDWLVGDRRRRRPRCAT